MDIKERFVSHRRKLLTISLTLLVYLIAGISFKTISFFGNDVEIKEPRVISIALWILWSYWLVRYLQIRRDLGNAELKERYEKEMMPILKELTIESKMRDVEWLKDHASCKTKTSGMIKEAVSFEPAYWEVKMYLVSSCSNAIETHENISMDYTYLVKGRELQKAKTQAYFRVFTRTPYLTEYGLPLFVAFLPILGLIIIYAA